jgi:hypothetical protein
LGGAIRIAKMSVGEHHGIVRHYIWRYTPLVSHILQDLFGLLRLASFRETMEDGIAGKQVGGVAQLSHLTQKVQSLLGTLLVSRWSIVDFGETANDSLKTNLVGLPAITLLFIQV